MGGGWGEDTGSGEEGGWSKKVAHLEDDSLMNLPAEVVVTDGGVAQEQALLAPPRRLEAYSSKA